jgi:hypothetical protein
VQNWKRYKWGRVHKRAFFNGAPEWAAHGKRELEVHGGPLNQLEEEKPLYKNQG